MDVSVTISPLKDSAGRIIGASKIARDITERRETEENLRHSEARHRAILESSLDAVVTMDHEGRIVEFNPAAESTFGRERSDAIGRRLAEMIIPQSVRGAHARGLAAYLATGTSQLVGKRLEMTALRADESEFPVELAITRINTLGPPLFTGFLRDISARKQAEDARLAAEAKFRRLVEQSLAGIYIIQGGRFAYVNPKMTEIFGFSEQELTSHPVEEFIAEADRPLAAENIGRRIDGKLESIRYQLRMLRKDGAEILVEIHGGRSEYNGQPAILGTLLDITARKRAEEALRESEEQFRTMVDAISQLAWMAEPDGYIYWYNQRWFDYTGTTPEQMEGWGWQRVHHPEILPTVLEGWKASIAAGVPFEMDFPLRGADGAFRWFLTRAFPLKDAAGQVLRWCGTNTDISRMRDAEMEVQRLNRDLEQRVVERTAQLAAANKELEAFSYSVSHDLRAPLRAIDGFSQALMEDCGPQLPEGGRRHLHTIRAGAQRMGMLIDDLLAFAQLSRAPLKKRNVNAGDIVREVLEDLSPQRKGRQLDVRIGELPECEADPALLKQVWINLLSNAFKYTQKREAAVVEIGCESAPEGNTYFVRDNGTGFDMRYAGKLFGVFQRLHRAEEYEGTGVGLAFVQRVIHRHGGRIWADAAVDRGATFYFTLGASTTI
jgi:PAS domain S-box-containing protein